MGIDDGAEQPIDGIPLPSPPTVATQGADTTRDTKNTPKLTQRQRATRGALAKIDSVYVSVHALETVSNLLKDVCSYLEIISQQPKQKKIPLTNDTLPDHKSGKEAEEGAADKIEAFLLGRRNIKTASAIASGATEKNDDTEQHAFSFEPSAAMIATGVTDWNAALQLPRDCLHTAIDGLLQHRGIIAQAIVNSSDTKNTKYAEQKLKKSQIKTVGRNLIERDPVSGLTVSLQYTQETLVNFLSRTNPDFMAAAMRATNKRKNITKVEQSTNSDQTAGGGLAKKQKNVASEGSVDSKQDARLKKRKELQTWFLVTANKRLPLK